MTSDTLSVILIVSILLGGLGLLGFLWALKSGQFDDEDKSAHLVLFDGEDELNAAVEKEKKRKAAEGKKD